MVLPAVAALKLTRRLGIAFVIAIDLAMLSTLCGVYISSWQGSEIHIIGAATVLVAVSALAGSLLRRV